MEQLVSLVSEKAGISQEQARTAVETVVSFLKKRLPAPVAGQVDSALSGEGGAAGLTAQGLGGKFGGKK